MENISVLKGFQNTCARAFLWREKLSVAEKVMLSVFFACFTGVMAQMRFYLPITPVPFTGQVFAVLLSAVMLGRVYGGLSQVIYAGVGFLGVPWFAGGMAGSMISPTTGYIIGFIAAAFFIGWATDRRKDFHFIVPQILILMTGVLIIYLCGLTYFAGLTGASLKQAYLLAVYPFILFDILKAISTGFLTSVILPKSKM